MSSERVTIGVLGGRDPREFGGVESVVSSIAAHSGDRYDFVQYCVGEENRVEESEFGTIRTRSDRFGCVRSKYLSSIRAARDLRRREVDLVHGHGDNALGLSLFRPSEPYVVTFHGTTAGMYANVFGDGSTLRRGLGKLRPLPELFAARQCDVAVACSERVQEELVSYYGIDPGKTVVIRNGVDTERFSPVPRDRARRRLDLDPDETYVLWIGTDPRRKALTTAVGAVEAMSGSVRLLVAGTDGEDTEAVRYLGRVPDERMADLYSAADVQCLCSLYEGFPLVLFESLACGTPVVASPFMPELDQGVYYVEEHSAPAYARALERVLADPPSSGELERLAAEHDWRHVAAEYVAVYEELSTA